MSTTSKVFLAGSVAFSAGTIFYVHYRQEVERLQLHEGVIKDVERQKMRQIENLHIIQRQKDLAKELTRQEAELKR